MVPCDRAMRSISRLGRLTDWGDIPCDRVPGPDTTVRTASGANQKSADIPVLQHKQPLSTVDTSGCRYTDPYSLLNNSVQAFCSGCARRMSNIGISVFHCKVKCFISPFKLSGVRPGVPRPVTSLTHALSCPRTKPQGIYSVSEEKMPLGKSTNLHW